MLSSTDSPQTIKTDHTQSASFSVHNQILQSVPKTIKRKAALFLGMIKDNNNLPWDEQGVVSYKANVSMVPILSTLSMMQYVKEKALNPKVGKRFQRYYMKATYLNRLSVTRVDGKWMLKSTVAFTGISQLYHAAKSVLKGIRQRRSKLVTGCIHLYLTQTDLSPFQKTKNFVGGIIYQWQADLADMQHLAKEYNNKKYLLCVIDVFSRFSWVIPIQNKMGKTLINEITRGNKTFSHINYKIKDLHGEQILGTYYEHELQLIKDDGIYEIDSFLDRRTRCEGKKIIKEIKVNWKGYPQKIQSWIPESYSV